MRGETSSCKRRKRPRRWRRDGEVGREGERWQERVNPERYGEKERERERLRSGQAKAERGGRKSTAAQEKLQTIASGTVSRSPLPPISLSLTFSVTFVFSLFLLASILVSENFSPSLPSLSLSSALHVLLNLIVALCSCFCFGVSPLTVRELRSRLRHLSLLLLFSTPVSVLSFPFSRVRGTGCEESTQGPREEAGGDGGR